MAVTEREIKPKVLTYEDYLREGETPGRYEIVDGVRTYMTNPASEHQIILRNLNRILEDYEEASGTGIAFISPVDVVTSRDPLKVRQPDLLYISFERWGDRDFSQSAPLSNPPELVIEILSPNETRRQIESKVDEYSQAGVLECWIVSPEASTIEQLELEPSSRKRLGIFSPSQTVVSSAFPGLKLDVERVFRLPKRPK